MAEEFLSLTRRRDVGFPGREVLPASPLYVTRDDQLIIAVWNSVAGVTVQVRARILRPDGELIPNLFEVVPTTDRVGNDFAFNLPEGFLLTLGVQLSGGTVPRGSCFVEVYLGRAFPPSGQDWGLLISDNISSNQDLGWPGGLLRNSLEGPGRLRSITGTDPAAGVEISETVPTNARWRLHALYVQFVTSATAATRRVHIMLDDGATTFWDSPSSATQTASQTLRYSAGNIGAIIGSNDSEMQILLPTPIPLFAGYRIQTETASLQAGDNYGAPQLLVEEWIED